MKSASGSRHTLNVWAILLVLVVTILLALSSLALADSLPTSVDRADSLELMLLASQERELDTRLQALKAELDRAHKAKMDRVQAFARKYKLDFDRGDDWNPETLEIKRAKKK